MALPRTRPAWPSSLMGWTPVSRTKCCRCWTRCVFVYASVRGHRNDECSFLFADNKLIRRNFISQHLSLYSSKFITTRRTVVEQLPCGLNFQWVFHLCTQSPHIPSTVQPPWCSQLPQLASNFRFFLPAAIIEFPLAKCYYLVK